MQLLSDVFVRGTGGEIKQSGKCGAPKTGAFSYTKNYGEEKKMAKRAFKTIQFKTETFDEEEGVFSGYGAVFGNIDSGGTLLNMAHLQRRLQKAGRG